jgi:hypothetical protein
VLFHFFLICLVFRVSDSLVKAAYNAYVEQELPNIRAEVPSPSPSFASAVLTIISFIATRVTLATV